MSVLRQGSLTSSTARFGSTPRVLPQAVPGGVLMRQPSGPARSVHGPATCVSEAGTSRNAHVSVHNPRQHVPPCT